MINYFPLALNVLRLMLIRITQAWICRHIAHGIHEVKSTMREYDFYTLYIMMYQTYLCYLQFGTMEYLWADCQKEVHDETFFGTVDMWR